MKSQLINMDDFEGLSFPDAETKRVFMDKMLADEINELILNRHTSKFWPLMLAGFFLSVTSFILPYPYLLYLFLTGILFILIACIGVIFE